MHDITRTVDSFTTEILTYLSRASQGKTNTTKKINILKAVERLKGLRQIAQKEFPQSEYGQQWLEEMRERIEAEALRANIPSDLEGKPPKPPKPPKKPYGVWRALIPIRNHAIGRYHNS